MKITYSVNNILLCNVNYSKIAQLDALADVYMHTCQEYVTAFCTIYDPNKYIQPFILSSLSARWHRAAIIQAAGIARSWRSNRQNARDEHEESCQEALKDNALTPEWKEWNIPLLHTSVLQMNSNVATLQPSHDSTFDCFLKVATLTRGKPVLLPIKLAKYHKNILINITPNTSMRLIKDYHGWGLTIAIDKKVKNNTKNDADVVGVDVGIANFITSSDGKHYGTLYGKLAIRQKKDRVKRKRKSKLRSCLKKKGIQKLPSVANVRLGRYVRQSINKAVNDFYTDHPTNKIAYEKLHVNTMKFKSRQMNAYLYASNLSHIPNQLIWGAQKRGIIIQSVRSAYTSQECNKCHYTDRINRKSQQTFCCVVCGNANHADINAAQNIAARYGDDMLRACKNRDAMKLLLNDRHEKWLQSHQLAVVQLPAQASVKSFDLLSMSGVGEYSCSGNKTLDHV